MFSNKRTPKIIDLSTYMSVVEASKMLDDKYTNPKAVYQVSELVLQVQSDCYIWGQLIEIEHWLMTLFLDLDAVGQLSQVTENPHLLSQVVCMLPDRLKHKFNKLRAERGER